MKYVYGLGFGGGDGGGGGGGGEGTVVWCHIYNSDCLVALNVKQW